VAREPKREPKREKDPLVLVHDNATGGVSLWQEKHNQSAADRDGVSLADYIHAIYGMLVQARARRVLMIGCGGGTLASMLHRIGVEVVVAEIDARSLEIAHIYFSMPRAVETHVGDGLALLLKEKRRFDGIVLDAFDGKGIPPHLVTERFFRAARARMRDRGAVFLMNLIAKDDDDRVADGIALRMRKTWRNVRIADSVGWIDRNAVIAAGAVRKLRRPPLLVRPARGAAKLERDLKAMSFRPVRTDA